MHTDRGPGVLQRPLHPTHWKAYDIQMGGVCHLNGRGVCVCVSYRSICDVCTCPKKVQPQREHSHTKAQNIHKEVYVHYLFRWISRTWAVRILLKKEHPVLPDPLLQCHCMTNDFETRPIENSKTIASCNCNCAKRSVIPKRKFYPATLMLSKSPGNWSCNAFHCQVAQKTVVAVLDTVLFCGSNQDIGIWGVAVNGDIRIR